MLDNIDLKKVFKAFSKQKILIIGDVMIDSYMWGKVKRISPEAPVPVVSEIKEEERLGGAANVALNIKAMGAVPILCSVIGDDQRGQMFLELLNNQNLSDVGIIREKNRLTTRKTRVISGTQHLLRVDEETSDFVTRETEKKLFDFISTFTEDKNFDAIVIQDYDKGVITPSFLKKIQTLTQKLEIPVLVDPKKRNFLHFRNSTLFKPNFNELVEGLKAEIDKNDLEAIASAMEELRKIRGHEVIMVTLSEMGIIVNDGKEYHHISAETREIADVSGAGDTVISLAALCIAEKLSSIDTAMLSNLAGGQVCEKSGVVPVNSLQLLEEAIVIQEEESE